MEFPVLPDDFYESAQGKTHFRYKRNDSGQIACILPGFSIPSPAYERFASLLADTFSVLTIDYFGRGYSEPSPEFRPTVDGYVAQVLDLLTHLEITSCVLISFSFGSLVAANIVERNPALIKRLVFISPLHFLRNPIRPFQRFIISNSLFGPFFLRLSAQHFITADIAAQFADVASNNEAFWGTVGCSLHQVHSNPTFYSSFAAFIRDFSESAIPDQMLKVRHSSVRTLVLLGEDDRIINIGESKAWWTRWKPNVEIIVREHVGHLMFLEEPEGTSALLLARILNTGSAV
jgi:pimeloyl-ACP methyl ester carboxylesterase